jgi:hypothetical protein
MIGMMLLRVDTCNMMGAIRAGSRFVDLNCRRELFPPNTQVVRIQNVSSQLSSAAAPDPVLYHALNTGLV